MNVKDFWRREKHVALRGQSRNFRIAKWIVILAVAAAVYAWKGFYVVIVLFAALCMLGVALHFLLRWKTDRWTKSWGPYKRIPLENE